MMLAREPERNREPGLRRACGGVVPATFGREFLEQTMLRLADKVVALTGGASGIGRVIAERLVEERAVVGILDIDRAGAEATAAAIAKSGGRAFAFAADIVDHAAVERAIAAFEQAAGPVSGLVNNAGWDKPVPFVESDRELLRKVIDINLWGPLNVTHIVLDPPGEVRWGPYRQHRVRSGRVGSSGEAVYSACKAGNAAFTKSVAREVARQGIVMNTVCPGPTETPLLAGFTATAPGLVEALRKAILLRRLGQPADYPGIVCFLLSDDAAFITGQTISVSGGLRNPVKPHSEQPVCRADPKPTCALPAQHGKFMSKADELKFEGGAATKAEREYGNEGGNDCDHAR
jgi:2-hydroxycyclohexanecarboxyl-CoA dehydrogenase